jgi:hypothetical protein
MYIAIKTNRSTSVSTMDNVLSKNSMYAVSVVDYVPLQRWVNIAFSIQDAILTVFLDGDIYSVRSITDVQNMDPVNTTVSANTTTGSASAVNGRSFYSSSVGDMYIGDTKALVKGFISRVQYFNYALTQKDIQNVYASGPVKKSLLSFIGLTEYGVRSPVYKVSDE